MTVLERLQNVVNRRGHLGNAGLWTVALLICQLIFQGVAGYAAPPSRPGDVANFPRGPHPAVTPGSLCERPDTKRYPEGIPYCSRDVDSELKRDIMEDYDRRFGYRVTQMDRGLFKIDHFIPLCMGGSNRQDNLWPQHESVYALTDRIEQISCEKMAQGRLRQADAVAMIRQAKLDLSKVNEILLRVQSL